MLKSILSMNFFRWYNLHLVASMKIGTFQWIIFRYDVGQKTPSTVNSVVVVNKRADREEIERDCRNSVDGSLSREFPVFHFPFVICTWFGMYVMIWTIVSYIQSCRMKDIWQDSYNCFSTCKSCWINHNSTLFFQFNHNLYITHLSSL